MTEQMAIEERLPNETLENAIGVYETVVEATKDVDDEDYNPVLDKVTIRFLKELQQYRAIGLTPELIEAMKGHNIAMINELEAYQSIGTIEELQALKEKSVAKKPIDISAVRDCDGYIGHIGKCPCCEDIVEEDTLYCECGQHLDWE